MSYRGLHLSCSLPTSFGLPAIGLASRGLLLGSGPRRGVTAPPVGTVRLFRSSATFVPVVASLGMMMSGSIGSWSCLRRAADDRADPLQLALEHGAQILHL